jgi:hypothetical protein
MWNQFDISTYSVIRQQKLKRARWRAAALLAATTALAALLGALWTL